MIKRDRDGDCKVLVFIGQILKEGISRDFIQYSHYVSDG